MKTMKAAVMYGPGDIRVERVEMAMCPQDGLVIQVKAVGLCGSDIRNLTTDSRKGRYPHIFGHEYAGVVVQAGADCAKYRVGDRLFALASAPCMECENCRRGRSDLCTHVFGGPEVLQGGFAEYLTIFGEQIRRGNIFKLEEGCDFKVATLGEPLSSVYACQERIGVGLGDTVAILGAGPIGCLHAKLARRRGAARIIMTEINPARLEYAKRFGADAVIDASSTDPVEQVLKLTGGLGADKVISANPSTEAQQQAVFMTAPGGTAVFFGGVPKGALTRIDTNHVHYNSIWLYGHYGAASIHVQRAFELSQDPGFGAKEIISHVMPLDEINRAIAMARAGEALKVILIP